MFRPGPLQPSHSAWPCTDDDVLQGRSPQRLPRPVLAWPQAIAPPSDGPRVIPRPPTTRPAPLGCAIPRVSSRAERCRDGVGMRTGAKSRDRMAVTTPALRSPRRSFRACGSGEPALLHGWGSTSKGSDCRAWMEARLVPRGSRVRRQGTPHVTWPLDSAAPCTHRSRSRSTAPLGMTPEGARSDERCHGRGMTPLPRARNDRPSAGPIRARVAISRVAFLRTTAGPPAGPPRSTGVPGSCIRSGTSPCPVRRP